MLPLRIKLFHAMLGRLNSSRDDYFFSGKLKKKNLKKYINYLWAHVLPLRQNYTKLFCF